MFISGNHFHAVITGMMAVLDSQVSQAAEPKFTWPAGSVKINSFLWPDLAWLLNSIILYPWFKDTILLGRGTLLINMPQRNSWLVLQMKFFFFFLHTRDSQSFLLLGWHEGQTSLKVKIMVWLSLSAKETTLIILFISSTVGTGHLFHSHCDHLYSGSELAFSHS